MTRPLDVVTFGEAMALFAASECGALSKVTGFTKRVAGAELNVAIGLARLGHSVGWISRLGRDSFGEFILATLAEEHIDARGVVIDDARPTGMMLKTRSDDGSDPKTEYFRKHSAASALSIQDFTPDYVSDARHLHITGITPALSAETRALSFHAADTMRSAGATVSFDPNLRPALWRTQAEMVSTLNELASRSDIVLPGISEGKVLTGYDDPEDIARFYQDLGAKLVIVKLGERGAYFRTGNESDVVPGYPVSTVVDTVGAGDGFAVGVISALIEGKSIADAVSRGNWIGSLAVQVLGDSEGLPTREALASHQPLTQS